METAINYLLLLFAILYISSVTVGRTLTVRRKIKKSPITYGKTDSAHDFLGRTVKILYFLTVAGVVIYLTSENLYQGLLPIKIFEITALKIIGLILAYASMVWTIIAQVQMGASWRLGIDENQKTELIQKGLFKFSRHTIYLGVMTTSLSLFLVLPNVLNLIIFLMTSVMGVVQARTEEEHFIKTHGEQYSNYSRNTPRWL